MYSKSLLIAIAAFAVTATGAQAYIGSQYLERAGFSSVQVDALNQARDLRLKGKKDEARDLLLQVGVDGKAISSLRKAAQAAQSAIHEAVIANDYEAFKVAAAKSPLLDIITTKEDFGQFVEIHNLKAEKKFIEAKELMAKLGLPESGMGKVKGRSFFADRQGMSALTAEQRDAILIARQANDLKTVQEIMNEAGIETSFYRTKEGKHGRY